MKRIATVVLNLLLPGSAQVVWGRPGWGVFLAAVYGAALSALLLGRGLVPGLLGRGEQWALAVVVAGAWCASQVLLVRERGPDRSGEREAQAAGLKQAGQLWLRGDRAEALGLVEALLDRRPTEPVLHYVAARLWAEGSDQESRGRARLHLVLCRGCDVEDRWGWAVAQELTRLRGASSDGGG